MFIALIIIEIILSILLMFAVLMQSSKGGGLAGSLGSGGMGAVFGVRRTSDFLSRSTWILATVFIVLALITNIFFLPGKGTSSESIIQKAGGPVSAPRALPPVSQPAASPTEQQTPPPSK